MYIIIKICKILSEPILLLWQDIEELRVFIKKKPQGIQNGKNVGESLWQQPFTFDGLKLSPW
jgi:hypothetical protein